MNALVPENTEPNILQIRNQRVLLDSDLAELYGVSTKRLNEQVRRNRDRFPADFIFELDANEWANLKSQFATSSWGGRRSLPLAFTEHGAIMVASVLNSPQAVEASVYVVRAFVRQRSLLASHREIAAKLEALEQKTELLSIQHTALSHNTRAQMKQVFDALRQLMEPQKTQSHRPIGFVQAKTDDD